MPLAPADLILTPQEFRLLEGLRLNPRKSVAGRVRGERLTKRKGISIEFADFRDYADGDDTRHLDWNVLARMDSPVIRTYQDEEELPVHVLLDCSLSMDFGEPKKFESARRIAAAIAYLALCGSDAVHPRALGIRQQPSPALLGRAAFLRFVSWLTAQTPSATTSLSESLREFASGKSRAGLAILISDGLDPAAQSAVAAVAARGHEIGFIQVLSPEELDPDIEGDLRLLDSENTSVVEITAHGQALKTYRANLEKHCGVLATSCLRSGGRYVRATTTEPLDEMVKNKLRREGWVS